MKMINTKQNKLLHEIFLKTGLSKTEFGNRMGQGVWIPGQCFKNKINIPLNAWPHMERNFAQADYLALLALNNSRQTEALSKLRPPAPTAKPVEKKEPPKPVNGELKDQLTSIELQIYAIADKINPPGHGLNKWESFIIKILRRNPGWDEQFMGALLIKEERERAK